MDAVTPGMRLQRRRRREAERADRGRIRRRPPTPHPAGLRALGWTRPAPVATAHGARLLGAATAPVAITDRATVATAARAGSHPAVLVPVAVARGPLPAAASLPRPVHLGPDVGGRPASVAVPAVVAEPVAAPALPPAPPATGHASAPPPPAPPTPPSAAPSSTPAADGAPTTTRRAPRSAPRPEPIALSPSDAFAHALGLSPATAPAPPPAAPAARHSRVGRRPRDPWATPGRRGRVLLVAAAAVVVLGGVGTAVGVAVADRDTARVAGASATDGVVVDLATWLSGNVTTQQRIVTDDAAVARDLNARGVPVDTLATGAAPPVGAVVVATAGDGTPPAVTAVGSDSSVVLLAAFDGDDRTLTVGEVVGSGRTEAEADLEQAASTARAATTGLRNNAAVRIASDLDPLFTSGRLDLRASTMLAAIAQDQSVEVVAAPQDRAESRAGRPVRTLVVSVQDAQAVRQIAATARAPYAPSVEAARPDDGAPAGSLRLTWPAGAAVTVPFS